MAGTITAYGSLNGAQAQQQIPATKFTSAGDHYQTSVFSVPTMLGGVGGTAFLRIMPGEFAIGRFDAGIVAPAALAHTAPVELEYLILDA